jgi:hypothetical protein
MAFYVWFPALDYSASGRRVLGPWFVELILQGITSGELEACDASGFVNWTFYNVNLS